MIVERLRSAWSRGPGSRRSALSVAAYCHAFDVEPEVASDGGTEVGDREDR